MKKLCSKLIGIGIVFVFLLVLAPRMTPTALATNSNFLQNPGFESSTAWNVSYSSFRGSYAALQDSAYSHNGTYSSLTQTSNPLQEACSASVYQTLNVPLTDIGEFSYWIRKGSSATNGYDHGSVRVDLSGGCTLVYHHGFDGSAPPSDSGTVKYINAGNPSSGSWSQVSRNLIADVANKFGISYYSKNVTRISLMSYGYMDIETYWKYGQRVNWDDICLNAIHSKWTYMVYMCIDNDLETAGLVDFNEMKEIGSTPDVSVLVQLDRFTATTHRCYMVTPGLYIENTLDEVNMGDPNSLVNFVAWSVENYPADHYALILYDHGAGFQSVCRDYQGGYTCVDYFNTSEIETALEQIKSQTGVKIDLLGFCACLMADLQVAYQVRNSTDIYVASEEIESLSGWPFDCILGNLTANPSISPEGLGSLTVDCFEDFYGNPYYEDPWEGQPWGYWATLSATNLSAVTSVSQKMSDIGDWLTDHLDNVSSTVASVRSQAYEYTNPETGNGSYDYVDAYNLTQLLKQNINNTQFQQMCDAALSSIEGTIIANWAGTHATDSHGIHMFFPDVAGDYKSSYDALDMSNDEDTSGWVTFLKAYLGL